MNSHQRRVAKRKKEKQPWPRLVEYLTERDKCWTCGKSHLHFDDRTAEFSWLDFYYLNAECFQTKTAICKDCIQLNNKFEALSERERLIVAAGFNPELEKASLVNSIITGGTSRHTRE